MRDEPDLTPQPIGERLLAWYDRHARVLPWRIGPAERAAGRLPDPYRVWVSEIMLQQTTVAAVLAPYDRFVRRWPDLSSLAQAEDADIMAAWAGLGYYRRAHNLLQSARLVMREHGGELPRSERDLRSLPGIGAYTAGAIAAIAFDQPTVAMDGNAERVMARLGAIEQPMSRAKTRLRALAFHHAPHSRPGDYVQAIMDLGATICRPADPLCDQCPCRDSCLAFANDLHSSLPRRETRAKRPTRCGFAYIGRDASGRWLMERRPSGGLLGGMLGWPTSDWGNTFIAAPPASGDWQPIAGEVTHVFTHFTLILRLMIADGLPPDPPPGCHFIDPQAFDPAHLPTLMRKAFAEAARHFEPLPNTSQ